MVNLKAIELNHLKTSNEAVRSALINRLELLTSELETTTKQIESITASIEIIDEKIKQIPPDQEKEE